jgi:hypothetical protein
MMDGERRLQEGDTERACALSLPSSSVRRALSFFRSWKVEQGALARTWLLFRSSGGATMVFALRAKRWRAERKKAYDTLLPTLLFRAEPRASHLHTRHKHSTQTQHHPPFLSSLAEGSFQPLPRC